MVFEGNFPIGCGSRLNRRGYAGFGPCFHLPGFHFGTGCLSHSHSWWAPFFDTHNTHPIRRGVGHQKSKLSHHGQNKGFCMTERQLDVNRHWRGLILSTVGTPLLNQPDVGFSSTQFLSRADPVCPESRKHAMPLIVFKATTQGNGITGEWSGQSK